MKFKFRRYYLYYIARVAIFFISLLPPAVGLAVAGRLGSLAYYILGRYRRITIRNLALAFGRDKRDRELRLLGRRVFENLSKNAFELIRFPRINASNIDRLVSIENIETLNGALKKGNGVIIVTGHFGNWELIAATITLKGYSGAVIGRKIYFERYDRYLNSLRKMREVDIIYRDESPRKILRILRENKIIGILADQDVDSVEGVFVDFFGKKAYTPIGPVALARVSGAALVPTFMVRKNGSHTLVFEQPIELVDTGDKEKDMFENTRRWSDVFERYVRRYPEQWVWMHRRWKTQKRV